MNEIEKRSLEIANSCAKKLNLEILEVEYVKENGSMVLRIIADKDYDGGLDINDATLLNEAIGEELDKEDFIKDEYSLEVSSPGIERELKKEEDFIKYIGSYICIYTKEKVLNKNEVYGDLLDYHDNVFKIKVNLKGRMKEIEINKENIEKVRLAVKF